MISGKSITSKIVEDRDAPLPSLPAKPAPTAADLVAALSDQARGEVESMINRLFREIRDCRTAWRQAWSSTEVVESAKYLWLKALVENGVLDWDRQIEVGLRRLRAMSGDFAPSPGTFIALCQPTPESLGLPTAERAYQEACRNAHPSSRGKATWSHQAVYHAAIDVGLDVLMQLNGVETWKLFSRSYAVIVQRALTGQPLGADVPLGIGHDSQKPLAQLAEEQSLQFALRLREAQGLNKPGAGDRVQLLEKMRIKRSAV